MELNILLLLSIFIFSFTVGYFVNRFVLSKSLKYNLKKSNISAERWENQSKPVFGGISFYVVFILILLYYIFTYGISSINNDHLIACLLVVTLSFCMGLADDLLNTSPYFKFIVQFINASILIWFGLYIHVSTSAIINYITTYLWVIGIMNSFNMLDNMDAISSMIALTVLAGAFINMTISSTGDQIFSSFIITGSIGVILSFLIFFNWNPSKMYMGDNGSQFLGAMMAIIGILFFWNSEHSDAGLIALKPVYVTILAFLIPITDTTSVTINRLLKGKSPFIGGRDHTTHHLSYAGLSDRGVVIVLSVISLISVGLSVYLGIQTTYLKSFHILVFSAYIIIIFAFLYALTRMINPK